MLPFSAQSRSRASAASVRDRSFTPLRRSTPWSDSKYGREKSIASARRSVTVICPIPTSQSLAPELNRAVKRASLTNRTVA